MTIRLLTNPQPHVNKPDPWVSSPHLSLTQYVFFGMYVMCYLCMATAFQGPIPHSTEATLARCSVVPKTLFLGRGKKILVYWKCTNRLTSWIGLIGDGKGNPLDWFQRIVRCAFGHAPRQRVLRGDMRERMMTPTKQR